MHIHDDDSIHNGSMETHDIHSPSEHGDDSDFSSVLVAKAITMVCLCLVSMCMGIIPMQVMKYYKGKTTDPIANPRSLMYVRVLLGFGGGVLFCTTFLHILPEVEEGVEYLTEKGFFPHVDFSLAITFCCAGFFIMYFIEELVHARLKQRCPHQHSVNPTSTTSSNANIYTTESVENYGSVSFSNWKKQESCDVVHTHLDVIEDCDNFQESALRGLLIVLGLSVHELFEGLAIGLESSAGHVWYMFGAVAAHKFIIAFCIGVELTSTRTRTILCYVYVFMFAVVSPMGIGIGMLLVGGSSAASTGPVPVILQGLASGTLLYVVFFEILYKHRNGLIQYLSIIVGFGIMFGLQILSKFTDNT